MGEYFGHVSVDHFLVRGHRDRHPVVPVFDEVQAADPVHLDRRDRLAAPLGQREPFPAGSHPVGSGPEPVVEFAPLIERADDRVQPDGLQAKLPFAAITERADHLMEGHQAAGAVRAAAQPVGQPGGDLALPGSQEVFFHVRLREPGFAAQRAQGIEDAAGRGFPGRGRRGHR